MLRGLVKTFQSPEFWLPHNVTWEDVNARHNGNFPSFRALSGKLILVVGAVSLLRYLLIRFVFRPWGIRMKISSSRSIKAPFCEELECMYRQKGPNAARDPGRMKRITEATGLTSDMINRWFKIRRIQDEVPDLERFVEDCWMAVYGTILCSLGWYCLIGEPKIWGMDVYWLNNPFDIVNSCQEWYFLLGMAMFVTDSFVLINKKHETLDLHLRVYHHVVGFLLMCIAWTSNEVRLGTLILFMLETCSPPAFAGKLAEWLSLRKTSKFIFGLCFAHWFFVRTIWFHLVALPSIFVSRHMIVGLVPSYLILDVFLVQLAVTNVLWIKMIVNKISKVFSSGEFFKKKIDVTSWSELDNAINQLKETKSK